MPADPVNLPTPPELRVVTTLAAVSAAYAYDVARQMELLPKWASGLAAGISQVGGAWFADSPMGRVRIDMAPENTFGVLDHDVTLPDGKTVHNAFRVAPTDEHHCVFTFVVVRQPGTALDAFEADVANVEKDLDALRTFLEDESYNIELAKDATSGLEDAIAGRVCTPENLDALLADEHGQPRSIADALSMPEADGIDFDPPRAFEGPKAS